MLELSQNVKFTSFKKKKSCLPLGTVSWGYSIKNLVLGAQTNTMSIITFLEEAMFQIIPPLDGVVVRCMYTFTNRQRSRISPFIAHTPFTCAFSATSGEASTEHPLHKCTAPSPSFGRVKRMILRVRGCPYFFCVVLRKRLTCTNVIARLAGPASQEHENNTHRGRCDVAFYSRFHDASSSVHSNICFS